MNNELQKINQNLDTNFLKIIAIVSMFIDHFFKIFSIHNVGLAIIGRLAFPLFAYCVVVGCLYTHSTKKYLLRLTIFAVVSQPFYTFAFHPTWERFKEELLNLNILFTMIAGILAVNALMNIKKNWWMMLVAIAMEFVFGVDYGLYGIVLIMLFYIGRNKTWLSVLLVSLWMIFYYGLGDFLHIGPIGISLQFFAILALPLIYVHTNFNPRINKYFFYAFYPLHLLLLSLMRFYLLG